MDQPLLSFFTLLDLVLKHVIDSFVYLIKHSGQHLLRLVALLALLVELLVELTDLFAQHVNKDLTAVLSLLVLFENRRIYLTDLLAKRALVSIAALLSCFLLLGQLETQAVELLIDYLSRLDLVFFSTLAISIQFEVQPGLTLLDVCLAALVQHCTIVHLSRRLCLHLFELLAEHLDFNLLILFLSAKLVLHKPGALLN